MRLVGETTNPDGRTYVAVSSGNGWGLGRDPVTAIKTAVRNSRGSTHDVVVYYAVAETLSVDVFGGVNNSNILQGVTVPVGAYRASSRSITVHPDAVKMLEVEWDHYRRNTERAQRLAQEREVV